MVRLILFEYRKHFIKASIIIAMLLFSVLNIAKIYSVYDEKSALSKTSDPDWDSNWKGLYWEMYEEFGGTITDEKIAKLMGIYRPLEEETADRTASTATDNPNTYTGNIYNDYHFFSWNFVNPMEYAYMYKSNANDVVTAAKDNMDFYKKIGNRYEYRKNADIAKRYTERAIPELTYTEMYQFYLHYDFSTFLVLLICLYGLMNVFVSEKETEMDTLLLTTKLGGVKTTLAKLISSMIFVGIICSWFWLLDFVAFSSAFGTLKAAFAPLYAIENFEYASMNINLGTYAGLSAIVKTVGILVLGLVFLLISTLFKNALLPFIISLFTTFGFIYMQEIYMGSAHVLLKVINPFVLVVNRELFRKTEYMNLFGFPVVSFIPALLFAMVWGIICMLGISILVRKNAVYRKGVR